MHRNGFGVFCGDWQESDCFARFRLKVYYTTDTAPRYQITSDYVMFVAGDVLDESEDNDWVQQFGKFEEVKLSPLTFDDYFKIGVDGPNSFLEPDNIRKNTEKAWRFDVENDANGLFYYLILTNSGEVFLTYGYDVGDSHAAKEAGSLIRWVFKLARTDIFSCNAVSEDCNAYIEPAYYPEGFDWNYDELPEGIINEKGKLIFTADRDTDSLVISEDYYHNFNPENRSGSTTIEKETYTIQKNKDGQFELDVEIRSANGDMAVYFIEGPVGVYVMKIVFADDEAVLSVSTEEATPVNVLLE